MAKKNKKVKIPESVLELRWGQAKFAKKKNIRLKGKGMSKKRKKEARKQLDKTYAIATIGSLNKAVKILSDNPESTSKKIMKVREGVDVVISNQDVMKRIAKIYEKSPDDYNQMMFLPWFITNTIRFYQQEGLSDSQKEEGETLNNEMLLVFCERILKRQIKHYRRSGLSDALAFEMANTIPTTKLLKQSSSRQHYQHLLSKLYLVAEIDSIDIGQVLQAVRTVDKKKGGLEKKEFFTGFFSEFIWSRSSNKSLNYTDTQKELHENLIEAALVYLNSLKEKELREILKMYIRRRKTAEENKNDSKRVIRFIDHANSNSPYGKIKAVVQDLISDNSNNELYLS